MGLSGLGDLVLTCTSPQSRNFAFGVALGRGKSPADAAGGQLAEGATTARALLEMARARGVEMPIAESAAAVVAGEQDVRAVVGKLLARPAKAES
jgi:glycerol-3-phosphate dehydrogenase (NAD(P)+)